MTHPWPDGVPITVTLDDHDNPTQFLWEGIWYQIEVIIERWEAETDWWDAGGAVWQLYLFVLTRPKMLCVIRHDRQREQWQYLRLYD